MATWRVSFRNGRGGWKRKSWRLRLRLSLLAYRANKTADMLLKKAKRQLRLDLNNS